MPEGNDSDPAVKDDEDLEAPEVGEDAPIASSTGRNHQSVKDTVTTELTKSRQKQEKRFHSKRSVGKAGRPKGSKAKQDSRVHFSRDDGWE